MASGTPTTFKALMADQVRLDEIPANGVLSECAPVHQAICSLCDGDRVECHYIVRERSRRPTKRGGEWLALKLADRSGTITAKSWDDIDDRFVVAEPGSIVRVIGRFEASSQWGDAIIIDAVIAAAEGDYDPADLLEASPVELERLEADLRDLIATIQSEELRALLERFFGPGTEAWRRFSTAPAAKHYHQAYVHGLLEHTLSVAQSVSVGVRLLPGHRPRRRGHRRSPPRHRQDRGLQRRSARART